MSIPPFHDGVGIVSGIGIEQYHAQPDVSKSQLDDLELSPAIFFARHRAEGRPEREEKAGQLEGHLAHCAILEPEEFEKRYVIGPTLNRNTKAWKEFVEANAGRVAIQHDQYETATRQAVSVHGLPEIGDTFAVGQPEVSAFWIDDETGVRCRCRPDWVHDCGDSGVILVDVKTYSVASPNEFRRQVARKRYDVQAAFYSDGYEQASGRRVLGFLFAAVETEYPYAANAFMLDEDSLNAGRAKYRKNLRTYAECERTNTWPGYSTGIDVIRLPQWALISGE
jgi:hypothetical protein